MKRPVGENEIYEAIRSAFHWISPCGAMNGVGDVGTTAHYAAKVWNVHPNTARAWLNRWYKEGWLYAHDRTHRVLPKTGEEIIRVVYVRGRKMDEVAEQTWKSSGIPF